MSQTFDDLRLDLLHRGFADDAMSEPAAVRKRKSRSTGQRTRTGCLTCKARRVKCDEQKPVCKRCRDSRRRCGGYEDRGDTPEPASTERQTTPSLGVASSRAHSRARSLTRGHRELAAFDDFCTKTIPGLDGNFSAEFWNRAVLPLSQTEPAVHHAMVAVGAAHSLYQFLAASGEPAAGDEDQEGRGDDETRTERFTLVEYNKAIQALNNKLTMDGPRAVSIVLICCILFVCLEALNKNPERAIRHVESGRKIFNDWSRRMEQPPGGAAPSPANEEMRRNLRRIFTRIHHQVLMITGSQDWDDQIEGFGGGFDPAMGGIDVFRDADDAQDALDGLSKLIFPFLKASQEYKHVALEDVPADIAARREQLSNALRSFDASLATFSTTLPPTTPDLQLRQSLGNLRVQTTVLKVMLGESIGKMTTSSPRYEAALTDINAQCELVLQGAPSLQPELQMPLVVRSGPKGTDPQYTARAPSFALASGLPSALYFVSQNSSSAATRQQAVALLKAANINDGIWSSAVTAKIAEAALEAREPGTAGTQEPAWGLLELGRTLGVIEDEGDDDDDDGSNLAPSRGE